MKAFEPYQLKNLEIKNRIAMPPMCMYSADETGLANEFHYIHYETRAMGGVGMIIIEATGVMPNGRISDRDLGIWSDDQCPGLGEIVRRVKKHDCHIGIQLAHAGRKREGESSDPVAPSALPFNHEYRVPHALTLDEIAEIIEAFKAAAKRAVKAGFDFIEIHGAHGYLINQFLSPLSNRRQDSYGGSLENRIRLLQEIKEAIKEVIPEEMPLIVRVSATDYTKEGLNCDDMIDILNLVKEGIDLVHVSSGGMVNVPMTVYPGYQMTFSQRIKEQCKIDTMAVGLITTMEQVEEALNNKRCDLVAMGRLSLRDPYFTVRESHKAGLNDLIPHPYKRGF